LSLTIYLSVLSLRSGPRSWSVETIVHHKDTTKVHESPYPLIPFPPSPLQTNHESIGQQTKQPWLAAVICAAQDVERRMLIRMTWMRMFQHVPFDARFVVSNPGPDWNETLRFENQTFGDLIVLDHIPEDDITANTIKTLEFYKWLIKGGHKYEFVTKLDTDLWINAPAFWDRYLLPRMSNETGTLSAAVNRTIIGQLFFSDSGYNTFAHGSMYTVTWDMLELLVSLQERFNVITGEDAAVGILMHKGQEMANFINLRGEEKFDYDDADSKGDGTAWARPETHPDAISHALYSDSVIAVHSLKQKKHWMKVASCFDRKGIKPMPYFDESERRNPPFRVRWNDFLYSTGLANPYKTMFDTIPHELVVRRGNNWVCDGIWNLGKSKMGHQ
jgi:beta-1,3-galactosyltransferase 1